MGMAKTCASNEENHPRHLRRCFFSCATLERLASKSLLKSGSAHTTRGYVSTQKVCHSERSEGTMHSCLRGRLPRSLAQDDKIPGGAK